MVQILTIPWSNFAETSFCFFSTTKKRFRITIIKRFSQIKYRLQNRNTFVKFVKIGGKDKTVKKTNKRKQKSVSVSNHVIPLLELLSCLPLPQRRGNPVACLARIQDGGGGRRGGQCQTARRPGGGCRGLQVGGAGGGSWGYGRGSQHWGVSTLGTLRPWHSRRCRSSLSVREKFCWQRSHW